MILNTSSGLATPGGELLHQCCCRSRDVMGIVANARFSVQDWPIYGPGAGYLLTTKRAKLTKNAQNHQKTLSALAGDQPVVASVIKHSVFIKMILSRVLRLERGFLDHKVAPLTTKRPERSA